MLALSAHGASVANITSGGVIQGTSINLSSFGLFDWAAYSSHVTGTAPTFASIQEVSGKSGGTATISNILPSGTSTLVRGTDGTSTSFVNSFSWTGGTVASGSQSGHLTGAFGSDVDATGSGVHLTISGLAALPAGQFYQISLFGAVYNGVGTVTATVGSSFATQFSTSASSGALRTTELFQFNFSPDSAADSLDLKFILTGNPTVGDSSHATLQAVGISIVPEASSMLLVAAAGICGLARRRR